MEKQIMNINGISCYENNGIVYLNAEAVAKGLGFTQTKNGAEYVKWERVNGYLSEIGFSPLVGKGDFIPENVFYRLAMKAKNETAERFQAFIADEVIPTIRKTGGYVANDELFLATYLPNADEATKAMFSATLATVRSLNEKIEKDKPKVLFAEAVETADNSILIGDLAKLLRQNGVEVGQRRLFGWLRNNGYLIKSGESKNMSTQYSLERGLMEVKERTVTLPNESIRVTRTTKITGKGQTFFVNKFLGKHTAN